MRMWVYVVRRVVLAIPVLVGVMTVLFVFVSALPEVERTCAFYPSTSPYPSSGYRGSQSSTATSPCTTTIPCSGNPESVCPNPSYQAAVNSLGLNQPIYIQWAIYVGNSLSFQWGYINPSSPLGSGETGTGLPTLAGQSVTSVLAEFAPYSFELLLLTFAIAFLVVVPLQSRAVARPGGRSDHATRALTICGLGITLVILAPLALFGATYAFGGPAAASPICGSQSTVFLDIYRSWPIPPCPSLYGGNNSSINYPSWLNWGYQSTPTGFPTVDAAVHGQFWLALDTLLRMLLPALLLAFVAIAVILRYVRYDPTDRMDLEFLRGARARGLPESKVFPRQARRYTFCATLPALMFALIWVFSFLWIVELLFGLWGVGTLFFYAIVDLSRHPDYAVLYGLMLLFAYLFVATDIFAGSLRAYLDPRFRQT